MTERAELPNDAPANLIDDLYAARNLVDLPRLRHTLEWVAEHFKGRTVQPEDTFDSKAWAAWLRLVMPRYKDVDEKSSLWPHAEGYNDALDECFEALSKEQPPFRIGVQEIKQAKDTVEITTEFAQRLARCFADETGEVWSYDTFLDALKAAAK